MHDKLDILGMPPRLHYIFARGLSQMFDTEVVALTPHAFSSWEGFDEKRFNDYCLGDFDLTDRGRKLLLEGMLPTRQVKQQEERLSLSFHDWGLDFSESFSGILQSDGSGELSEFLRNLPRYEYDETELHTRVAGFISAHKTDRRIGLGRNEVIDAVEIAKTSFLHIPARLRLVLEYSPEMVYFSITSGNEGTDAFLFKYLSGDNLVRAIGIMNGTADLLGGLGLPETFVPAGIGDIPADILKVLRFKSGLEFGYLVFILHSEEMSHSVLSWKHGFRTLEIPPSVMDGFPYRPLALKIGKSGSLSDVSRYGELSGAENLGDILPESY